MVAVGYVATALAAGGYSPQFRAGATVLVWAAVIVGLGFGLWPRARVPGWAVLSGGALLALGVLGALSMGWASDDGAAFGEAVRTAGYLGVFVLVVLAAPPLSAHSWLTGVALGLVAVAALALASRIEPDLFPEQDLVSLLPSVRTRLSYPLNYWNGLAACMAMSIVALVWLGGNGRTGAGRAAAVAALPVPALTLFLTSSRGGVFALGVGIAALFAVGPARARMLAGAVIGGAGAGAVILLADRRDQFVDGLVDQPGAHAQGYEVLAALLVVAAAIGALRLMADRPLERLVVPRPAALATGAVVLVALLVAALAVDPAHRWDAFKDPPAAPGPTRGFVTRHLASAEGNGRYQFWETALDAFAEHPVRGIGAGGYEAWWAQNGSLAYFIRDAHSLPAELLGELGVLGLLALLGFLGGAAAAGLTARSADPRAGPAAGGGIAILACGAASAAIDWTWELPAAFGPAVVAAAVLAGPALRAGAERRPPRWGLGVATLALAWVALVSAGIVLAGETKISDSRSAARSGDLADAAADAQDAKAIEPWSAAPRLQLALVRERQGDLPGARRAAREAAERAADDWQVWLVITRLDVKAGDTEGARRSLRRARALNPRSPLFAPGNP